MCLIIIIKMARFFQSVTVLGKKGHFLYSVLELGAGYTNWRFDRNFWGWLVWWWGLASRFRADMEYLKEKSDSVLTVKIFETPYQRNVFSYGISRKSFMIKGKQLILVPTLLPWVSHCFQSFSMLFPPPPLQHTQREIYLRQAGDS